MERFCDKCGTLVSGEGKFCPTCGAPMESAVDLGKPAAPATEPMQPVQTTNTYGQSQNYAQMPNYPQTYNAVPSANNNAGEMTVGQWVLTIFLSSLGIIGIVLLFVWGFSNDTPTAKKNYARAMLIWQAIVLGIVILYYIGMIICIGSMFTGMEDFFEYYGAFLLR